MWSHSGVHLRCDWGLEARHGLVGLFLLNKLKVIGLKKNGKRACKPHDCLLQQTQHSTPDKHSAGIMEKHMTNDHLQEKPNRSLENCMINPVFRASS